MLTTLPAPTRPGGREQSGQALAAANLPEDLTGQSLKVQFAPRMLYTISFIDQLVYDVLVERRADELVLVGLSSRLKRVATDAAAENSVADRLRLPDTAEDTAGLDA